MKIRDVIISIGSFILGCVVTLNFIDLTIKKSSQEIMDSAENNNRNSENLKLFSNINYFLVIVIISCSDNIIQRSAIRETWGLMSKDFPDVQYFFIIGSKDLSEENILKIKNEQINFNDLFLLPVSDSYGTLTKKMLYAYAWFSKEFNFKYILKCDDDTFVFLPKVIHELRNRVASFDPLYWGYFNGKANIKQVGKWKETQWFLCDRYLPYALGGGYVISQSLVRYIKENENLLGTYMSEDVSVGVWFSPLNITRLHDVRFDTAYLSRGCNNSFLVTHKQTPDSMRELYSTIVHTGKLCKVEVQTMKYYEYNWKVLPSKCCVPEVLPKLKKN